MSGALGRGVTAVGLDVGLISRGWSPQAGGVETYTRDLARGLAARGHRVHALCPEPAAERAPYSVRSEVVDGVEVRRVAPAREQGTLRDLVADARADDAVLAWMAETPCDVIHVHHLCGLGVGALRAIHEMGRPLVVSLHDAWLFCPCGQPVHALAEPRARLACARARWPRLVPPGDAGHGAVEERRALALASLEHAHRLLVPSSAAREVCAAAGLPRAQLQVVEYGPQDEPLAADRAAWDTALRGLAAEAEPREDRSGRAHERRSVEDVTRDHERLYVELAREVTGHVPELVHPLEGSPQEPGPAAGEPPPAARTAREKRGLLGRLFGR